MLRSMKIRLPSSLMNNNNNNNNNNSDDISCSSETSSSNKSARSFLSLSHGSRSRPKSKSSRSSSRSKSGSRLRQRSSRTVRDEKPRESESRSERVIEIETTTAVLETPRTPTHNKIMKRLQKSFGPSSLSSSSLSLSLVAAPHTAVGNGDGRPKDTDEKENTIPSFSAPFATNAGSNIHNKNNNNNNTTTSLPPIDSAIVSIADRAVARNFPSCIRPVPIHRNREGIGEQQATATATTQIIDIDGSNRNSNASSEILQSRAMSFITTDTHTATKNIDHSKAATNKLTTKTRGNSAALVTEGVPRDDDGIVVIDCAANDGTSKPNSKPKTNSNNTNQEQDSPYSIAPSDSLLPPLVDDDEDDNDCGDNDNGIQTMLLPERRAGNTYGTSGLANNHNANPIRPPPSPPPSGLKAFVSSPLSNASGLLSGNNERLSSSSSSCDSSVSMARSSVMFDSNDGSNDHIAYLTKSTFKPPREVVTIITSGPVAVGGTNRRSEIPYSTPGRQRKQEQEQPQKHPNDNSQIRKNNATISSNIDEKEDLGKSHSNQGSGARRKTKEGNSSSFSGDDDAVRDDEVNTARELAAKLVVDLEAMREENERHLSKNRRLETKLQILKAQQDEHMVHRGRLIKACLYTAPVFLLCGGLDSFLATILLVWVLIEVESYLDTGNEGNDDDEDDGYDDCDEDGNSQEGSDDGGSDESFGDDGSSMSL